MISSEMILSRLKVIILLLQPTKEQMIPNGTNQNDNMRKS